MTEHSGLLVAGERTMASAFIGIQEAFMWLNRAVFQPARIDLPPDTSS